MVVNPVAPNHDAEKLHAALVEAFDQRHGRFRVFETSSDPDLCAVLVRELTQARAEGCDLAIAAGGDGTVSLLANALARSHEGEPDLPFGIVPLGTANVLARELGIPLDIPTAVAVAAERRRIEALDAIGVGDDLFLTQVGVGLDAGMIADTTRAALIKHGRLAYFVAFLRRVPGRRSHRFVIDVDGRKLRLRAWQVVLANAGTLATPPFTWGPDIETDDGVLDLCIYNVRTFSATMKLAWKVLANRHQSDENVRYVPVCREVTIASFRPLTVQGDGELIGNTPITLRVVPGAVRVVLPEPPPPEPRAPATTETKDATASVERTPAPPADTPAQATGRNAEQARRLARLRIGQHVLLHGVATFGAIDAGLFLKVNGMPGGRPFDLLMSGASRLMDLGEIWIVVAVAAALRDPAAHAALPISIVAPLWLTMLTVNFPIKALFQRRRPFVAYVKARVVGGKPADSSFPSGHSAAAFAGSILLAIRFPELAPLLYAYASTVAFSRVYLGVHYPSDVVIGALTGTTLALFYDRVVAAALRGLL